MVGEAREGRAGETEIQSGQDKRRKYESVKRGGIWHWEGHKEGNSNMGQWSQTSSLPTPLLLTPDLLETHPQLCAPLSRRQPSLKTNSACYPISPAKWSYWGLWKALGGTWRWRGLPSALRTGVCLHVSVHDVCDGCELGCLCNRVLPTRPCPPLAVKGGGGKRTPPWAWHLTTDKECSH